MKGKLLLLSLASVCFSMILSAQTTDAEKEGASVEWNLDKAHSKISFTTVHMGISEIEGSFKEFDGSITSTSEDFIGSKVAFSAQVASISTDNERRDGHLKSADFFDAENHPELKFSGEIVKENDDYFLVGDLTMRGVTKNETFNVKYNGTIQGRSGPVSGFKVQGKINRFDYGLKFDSAMPGGDLIVGKMVTITANIEMGAKKTE